MGPLPGRGRWCGGPAGAPAAVLFSRERALPRTGSYTLEAAEASVWDSFVQTADSEMSRMNRGIVNAAPVTWRGNSSILLTLTGPAEPGAALCPRRAGCWAW